MLIFPAAEFFYEGPDVARSSGGDAGRADSRRTEESFNHTARVCRIGPDDKLYISLGQPYNVHAAGEDRQLHGDRDRRHHPHEPRRQEPRGLRRAASATRSARTSTPQTGDALVHRQSGGRHGRRHSAGRDQSHDRGRPCSSAIRGMAAATTRTNEYKDEEVPAEVTMPPQVETGGARRGSRHDVLHRLAVPGEVSGRYLLGPARVVEPHHAGRGAGDGDHRR